MGKGGRIGRRTKEEGIKQGWPGTVLSGGEQKD